MMSTARKYSFRLTNKFTVSESSETGYHSSHRVCNKIFHDKACSDKYPKKLYIAQPDKIDKMHQLQKLHQKCEKHYAYMDCIMIILTAEYALKQAVNRPHNDSIAAVITQNIVMLRKRDKHLYSNKYYQQYYIWQSFLHRHHTSSASCGKIPRLRLRMPFIIARAMP